MGKAEIARRLIVRSVLAVLLLVAVSCDSDSPTAPQQNPQPPASGAISWNITVAASRSQLQTGSDEFAVITVTVRRADNQQPPPDGATIVVATSLGDLGSMNSGVTTASVTLTNGLVSFTLFPGSTEGTAVIQAALEESIGQASLSIIGAGDFLVFRIEPNIGSPSGGDIVVIQGSGFLAPVEVTFEEDAESFGFQDEFGAEVLSMSFNEITIRTPAAPQSVALGQRLFVDVVVTIRAFTPDALSRVLQTGFSYAIGASLTQPFITSVTPDSGPNEGGTRLVITGDGFQEPVQVLFGQGDIDSFDGVEAVVESVSSTQIVCITPPATAFGQNNLNARVNILVRNQNTGLAGLSTSAFEYGVPVLITSIGPTEGPWFGDQIVTIFGQGFDEPVAVELGGFGQFPLSVSGTEIVVRLLGITTTSCNDRSGVSRVVNIETGDFDEGPVFTYRVPSFGPTIGRLFPNSGPQVGGTTVTITGANLRSPLRVTFGNNRPANITSLTPPATVVVLTPPLPDETLRTEACDDDLDGTMGERFLPTTVDVRVTNIATTCDELFEDIFTYIPSDSTCRNDAGPPPPPPPPPPPVTPPSADFAFTIVAGSTSVQFQDRSTNPVTWAWDFDTNGTPDSFQQNPLFDYGAAASGMSFTVTLTVTNTAGSSVISKTVGPLP